MSLRKLSVQQRRISEYYDLLVALSRRPLPWVCENPKEIEKLLALQSAALLDVRFDAPLVFRDGSRHIARAVVLAIPPEGRQVLHKAAQASLREISMPASRVAMAGGTA